MNASPLTPFLAASAFASAQTGTLSGTVTDAVTHPGRYRVILLEGKDARSWADPEILRMRSAGRDLIELKGGQTTTVKLTP